MEDGQAGPQSESDFVAQQLIVKNRKQESNSSRFPVGEVVGLHGLQGYLKIRPETNNAALLLEIKTVEIDRPGKEPVAAKVKAIKVEKRMIMLSLKDYPDRTSVEPFVGAQVFTDRSQLSELDENEWWSSDLIGLEVYTTDGALVGTVCDVLGQTGDYLEIKKKEGEGGTALVPFVKDLVPEVDVKGGRIYLALIPGLLD